MRRCYVPLMLLVLFVIGAESPDDLEQNRQLLEKWRGDREHYERLLRDLHAFWELPAERREQLRRLDRELHAQDARTQKRLWDVMDRYSSWLEHLPEADRRRVLGAAPSERLQVIKEIRQRQWLERLPRKVRERLDGLPPPQRAEEIARLQKEERLHRKQWQRLPKPPSRLTEFSPRVQEFVNKNVLPRLGTEEKGRLQKAEGRWPQYARTLLALAEKHPVLPPLPPPAVAPVHYRELPVQIRQQMTWAQVQEKKLGPKLRKADSKWPDFALAVVDVYKQLHPGKTPPPLGASRPKEFPAAVTDFIEKRLPRVLTSDETRQLRAAEGKWPDYPELLLKLARKHRLTVPGLSLPGPPEVWERARAMP